jgi:outer membrane protein assembly factor BamA
MRLPILVILVVLGAALPPRAEAASHFSFQPREVIADIRVHGNQIATDDEVVALSGVKIGDVLGAETLAQIGARLRAARRFDTVEVLKRFASLDDPSQIVIVLIVNEGPVSIGPQGRDGPITVKRRRGAGNLMFLPIIDSEDGYGLTYGAIVAVPNVGGPKGRIGFPLSWGGERQAAAEYERGFNSRVITRTKIGAGIVERTNPFYEIDDTRRRVWGRVERNTGPVRLGTSVGWQHVDFSTESTSFPTIGADATLDTRLDPYLPRNAVFATAKVERFFFPDGMSVDRHVYEARGYIGFVGQTVIVLRVLREDGSAPLRPYLKPLLGGIANLRGFDAGFAAGDTLAAGSAEVRVPLTTPLSFGKIGVSVFMDTGAICNFGERLQDQVRHTGAGGAVWLTAAMFHMSFSVAHGMGAHTRAQFDIGFGF